MYTLCSRAPPTWCVTMKGDREGTYKNLTQFIPAKWVTVSHFSVPRMRRHLFPLGNWIENHISPEEHWMEVIFELCTRFCYFMAPWYLTYSMNISSSISKQRPKCHWYYIRKEKKMYLISLRIYRWGNRRSQLDNKTNETNNELSSSINCGIILSYNNKNL